MLNTGKQPFFMVLLYSLFTYLELKSCVVDVTPLQPLVEAVANICSSCLDPELIKHRH